jgi:hypothetical protein
MLFCAHAIFYFKVLDQIQNSFLVQENVYLIGADDYEQALVLGNQIGIENQDESLDGHLEINDKKAAYLFAGIRKLIEVEPNPNTNSGTYLEGLELTYSQFEVDTLDQVMNLAKGEMVELLYRE